MAYWADPAVKCLSPLNLTLRFAIRAAIRLTVGVGPEPSRGFLRSGCLIARMLNQSESYQCLRPTTPSPILSPKTCDIPRDTIKPESHAINDLGIDSLTSSTSPSRSTRRSGSSCRSSSGRRKSTTARRPPISISFSRTSAPASTNSSLPRELKAPASCVSSTFS